MPVRQRKKIPALCGRTAAQSAAPVRARQSEANQLRALMRAGRYAEVELGARTLTARAPDARSTCEWLAVALTWLWGSALRRFGRIAITTRRRWHVRQKINNAAVARWHNTKNS
jgi:hypothetical protein